MLLSNLVAQGEYEAAFTLFDTISEGRESVGSDGTLDWEEEYLISVGGNNVFLGRFASLKPLAKQTNIASQDTAHFCRH